MVSLSEIPEANIRSLEEAMRIIGVSGVSVDGNPEDITTTQIVPFIDKLSRALGESGMDFGHGDAFRLSDYNDPAIRVERLAELSSTLEGFRNSPQLGLVREIMSDSPNYDAIEGHLTTIGIADASGTTAMIRQGLNNRFIGVDGVLNGTRLNDGLVETAESLNPNFARLREILGDQAMDNISSTLAVMDASEGWLEVLGAIAEDAPDVVLTAEERAAIDAAHDAEVAVVQAEQGAVLSAQVQAVETVLGIETPDGVWGDTERNALKTYIGEMQSNDPTWLGREDGVYTNEYANHVRGNAYGSYTAEQIEFFEQLGVLDASIPLRDTNAVPANHDDILAAIGVVEEALTRMVPIVQQELDTKRAEAESLIDSIHGSRASDLQREAAARVLADPDSPEEHRIEAQDVLDQSNLGNNIGDFLDGFIGLGQTEFGHRLVRKGQEWAANTVRGQLAQFDDLPPVSDIHVGDGRLDIGEQTALQGITTLLAKKFNIGGADNWHYTPALGQRLLAGFESMEDGDKLLLLDEEAQAQYEALSDDNAKRAFLDQHFEIEKGNIVKLLQAMDLLYDNDVLVAQRLYDHEEPEIAPLTQEIFDEYIQANAADPAQLNMLNMMTYEFTDGFDLGAIMGSDYAFPAGIEPIDPTQTIAERFAAHYREGLDIEHMADMLDTLPFGTDARRAQMKGIVQNASRVVTTAKENDPDISVEMLAILYANAMDDGISAMNNNPEMRADYLFVNQRPITMDPRLGDTISANSTISVDDVYALHKSDNRDFTSDHYQALFFKDENGVAHVAAFDHLTNVFTISEIDFDHWDQVVESTPKLPGERQNDYDLRLDAALSEVSGYNLLFQNNFRDHQTTLVVGTNAVSFTSVMRDRIGDYDDVRSSINTRVGAEHAAEAREARARAVAAATPQSAADVFASVARGEDPSALRDPERDFAQNADELTRPSGDIGGVNGGHVPSSRLPLRVGAPLSVQ